MIRHRRRWATIFRMGRSISGSIPLPSRDAAIEKVKEYRDGAAVRREVRHDDAGKEAHRE